MENNSKKIIYIEDNQEMIDLVALILTRHGFQVTGSTNGREGINLILQLKPDLILLDLMIPDIDGWEIYKQLETNDLTKDIPVIIITAKSQNIDKVLGLHIAKVDDYICKPFHPNDLLESVQKVLGK